MLSIIFWTHFLFFAFLNTIAFSCEQFSQYTWNSLYLIQHAPSTAQTTFFYVNGWISSDVASIGEVSPDGPADNNGPALEASNTHLLLAVVQYTMNSLAWCTACWTVQCSMFVRSYKTVHSAEGRPPQKKTFLRTLLVICKEKWKVHWHKCATRSILTQMWTEKVYRHK